MDWDWFGINHIRESFSRRSFQNYLFGIQCKFRERIHPALRFHLFLDTNRCKGGYYKK
ncbi:hypothetical protein SBDP2_20011 [Syntrophobacter sp. SbD2]|nr:hypothetical protein SBDP2_20011 [Syntrophobacter sp. SbD2]